MSGQNPAAACVADVVTKSQTPAGVSSRSRVACVAVRNDISDAYKEICLKRVSVYMHRDTVIARKDCTEIFHILAYCCVVLHNLEAPYHFSPEFFGDLSVRHKPVRPRCGKEAHRAVRDSVFVQVTSDYGHYYVEGGASRVVFNEEDDVFLASGKFIERRSADWRFKGGDKLSLKVFERRMFVILPSKMTDSCGASKYSFLLPYGISYLISLVLSSYATLVC